MLHVAIVLCLPYAMLRVVQLMLWGIKGPVIATALMHHTTASQVTRWLSTCGNAVVEGLEECDDGDLTDGDGCRSVIQLACQITVAEHCLPCLLATSCVPASCACFLLTGRSSRRRGLRQVLRSPTNVRLMCLARH